MINLQRVARSFATSALLLSPFAMSWSAFAADSASPEQYLSNARALSQSGQYFRSARYSFAALEAAREKGNAQAEADSYSLTALGLIRARLYHSASYFFIKTLQTGNKSAIRRVLTETQNLLQHVGADVLRKYLIRHTSYEDYDSMNRSAFLYSLGKDALLAGEAEKAVGYLSGIQKDSPLWPFALQLRGSAYAILGDGNRAVEDFKTCTSRAGDITRGLEEGSSRRRQVESEADDLSNRCQAGIGRAYYQMDQFENADRAYDLIQKASIVWPEVLFEQAWNGFARQEYNRALGKLVSYKSPALSFVFNPETDVLRAQSYLALCLYDEANDIINDFNGRYAPVGEEVKHFVEKNASNLPAFFEAGKTALSESIYSTQPLNRMLNTFIRGPYFLDMVHAEADALQEIRAVAQFGSSLPGMRTDPGKGFPGFVNQVLRWRIRSVQVLGGIFVKNSLLDHHTDLISDFEKMAFIKLEMLKRAKDRLVYKNARSSSEDRGWGNEVPKRKDYQYYWTFNGEFWNDELGDYVFGLESQCRGGDAS